MNLKINVKRRLKRVEKVIDTEISYIQECVERTKCGFSRFTKTMLENGLDTDGDVLFISSCFGNRISVTTEKLKLLCDEEDSINETYLNERMQNLEIKKRIIRGMYEDKSFYCINKYGFVNMTQFKKHIISKIIDIQSNIYIKKEMKNTYIRTSDEQTILSDGIYSLYNELEVYMSIANEFKIPILDNGVSNKSNWMMSYTTVHKDAK